MSKLKATKQEAKCMHVLTLPLKYELWQRDIMDKRFELCRKVYNAMLGYEIKQYRKMTRDPRYAESTNTIDAAYKGAEKNENGKAKIKKTPELEEAYNMRKELAKEYGFTEFAFLATVKTFYKDRVDFSQNISSAMAGISIAKPMWAAFSSVMYRKGEQVSFKKYNNWRSVATDGKSGIRMVDTSGNTIFTRPDNEQVYILYGTSKGRVLKMPVIIKDDDVYAKEALSNNIKIIRIVRKVVKGMSQYSVQFTVEGVPPVKYRADGEEKHPIGKGKVGIYIDTTSVTAVNTDGIHEFSMKEGLTDHSGEIARIQQYLDASRRFSNPDNFTEDGTAVKKGQIIDGKRVKLNWKYSKGYKKARAKLSDLFRMDAETRDIQRNILANKLLALGDEFYINDYPFQYAAQRKKEAETDSKGRQKSKKRAGKTIGKLAPAAVVEKLDMRLKSRGYDGVVKIKLNSIDKTHENYRQIYAAELYKATAEE